MASRLSVDQLTFSTRRNYTHLVALKTTKSHHKSKSNHPMRSRTKKSKHGLSLLQFPTLSAKRSSRAQLELTKHPRPTWMNQSVEIHCNHQHLSRPCKFLKAQFSNREANLKRWPELRLSRQFQLNKDSTRLRLAKQRSKLAAIWEPKRSSPLPEDCLPFLEDLITWLEKAALMRAIWDRLKRMIWKNWTSRWMFTTRQLGRERAWRTLLW